ncbi:hypothetical protein P3T76_007621 [Phytophthora citrophthora]|uniref:Uncharacterized protein n=1 Tax=Phytophthora citrophthora TaxID=4793 RepID=A0AAD9GLU5_9STRA|nr:hypothetical protein P3T76_007621 [Phytophthora citrophthora]
MTDSSPIASMWRAFTPVSSTLLALEVATMSANTTIVMQLKNFIVDTLPSEQVKQEMNGATKQTPLGFVTRRLVQKLNFQMGRLWMDTVRHIYEIVTYSDTITAAVSKVKCL